MYKRFIEWLKKVTETFDKAGIKATEDELPLEDKNGNPFEINNQKRFM